MASAVHMVITGVGAYFLGSIPTGYLVARARGVDIRSVGSGNIGATNAFRVLGKGPGTFVLAVDALKGFLAVILVRSIFAGAFSDLPSDSGGDDLILISVIAGVCAILGHNFTCWLNFKGGKGVATTAGVLLGLMPIAFAAVLSTWLVVFVMSRYVSVASIVASMALPIATWFAYPNMLLRIVAFLLGALAIFKHRSNIGRLMNGTETRFGASRQSAKEPSK